MGKKHPDWEALEGQYFLLGMWQHEEFLTSMSLCHPAGIACILQVFVCYLKASGS